MTPKNLKKSDEAKRLILEKGIFFLEEVSSFPLRKKLSRDPFWKAKENDSFETRDLGAALIYRRYADERLEKLFKKTLQEHYTIPKELPPLSGLDPHQREGVRFILSRKRAYLVHAPGAGKTGTAITASLFARGEGQTLFIVPPSLAVNWQREIEKFTEMANVFRTIGTVKRSEEKDSVDWNADIILVPDSMLAKSWVQRELLEREWKFIAVDEASRFKEITSERSLAFYGGSYEKRKFKGIFRSSRHVVFLDGSPMPNRPMELWAPCYALHPESIDALGQDDFGYRYCGARPNERGIWEFRHSSNEEELREKLRRDFFHVVAEEALDHPERKRSLLFMEDIRSREHKEWERKNLKGLTDISEDSSQGDLARFRRELGLKKVPFIARYVKERLQEKNESILLFVWHREVAFKLAEKLSKSLNGNLGLIIGGTSDKDRENWFSKFNEKKTKLLILNIAAGGRGHNLQKADRVIFGEFSWTDETNKQCEKRASRRGSDKDMVRCEYIVVPDSMDELVMNSIFTKERRVRRVIG